MADQPDFGSTILYTDPMTGYYGLSLVTGVTYTLETDAVVPGYQPDTRVVALTLPGAAAAPESVIQNIPLSIDATACNAPGYGLIADGLSESFDTGALPPGWNIVNDGGGAGWTIHSGADPWGPGLAAGQGGGSDPGGEAG